MSQDMERMAQVTVFSVELWRQSLYSWITLNVMPSAAMGSAAFKEDVMLTSMELTSARRPCVLLQTDWSAAQERWQKHKLSPGIASKVLARVSWRKHICIARHLGSAVLFLAQKLRLLVFSHNFVFLYETVCSSCEIQITVKAFRQ